MSQNATYLIVPPPLWTCHSVHSQITQPPSDESDLFCFLLPALVLKPTFVYRSSELLIALGFPTNNLVPRFTSIPPHLLKNNLPHSNTQSISTTWQLTDLVASTMNPVHTSHAPTRLPVGILRSKATGPSSNMSSNMPSIIPTPYVSAGLGRPGANIPKRHRRRSDRLGAINGISKFSRESPTPCRAIFRSPFHIPSLDRSKHS